MTDKERKQYNKYVKAEHKFWKAYRKAKDKYENSKRELLHFQNTLTKK